MAAAAAAFLALAEFDSRVGGKRSPRLGNRLPSSMQLAAAGAALIRSLVRRLDSISLVASYEHRGTRPTHSGLMLAGELRHVLEWLAEPTTPVATASAVLVEALAGLEALLAVCPRTRRALAEAGGSFEWAPVARALHRRLPRRMAARFLPDVDRLSAAVDRDTDAEANECRNAVAVGEAEAAMAALKKVRTEQSGLIRELTCLHHTGDQAVEFVHGGECIKDYASLDRRYVCVHAHFGSCDCRRST